MAAYTFLLQQNTHKIILTTLKCTIQWHSAHSRHCTTIATLSSPRMFFIIPNGNPIPNSIHSPFPILPPPQPLKTRLSLCICPFWVFHINGVIHGLLCLASFTKRNVFKVHPRCSIYKSSLWLNKTPLWEYTTFGLSIYLLIDIWVVSTFE